MSTMYNINPMINGINGWGQQFPTNVVSANLAAATNTQFTVPGTSADGFPPSYEKNQFIAIFSYAYGEDFWVNVDTTAAAPGGPGFVAGSQLNPAAIAVKAGQVINIICTAGAMVSISLYAIQNS